LHGVEDAGSLTVVAERVRAALESVQRQLVVETIGTIVFVARGSDCALIFSGPAQAIRCRGSQAVAVVGIADDWDDDDLATSREPRALEPANTDVELIDLITGTLAPSVEAHVEVDVRYESLSDGQRWLIAGMPSFTEDRLDRIAAAVAIDEAGMAAGLEAVRAECAAVAGRPGFGGGTSAGGPLPVLLLGVAKE
jgi:hypothetical protein